MARKRMISPEIWENDDFSEIPILARLLFIGMISNADDFGKGKANPRLLKSKVFPYDEGITTDDINDCFVDIAMHTSTVFYQNGGTLYYQLTTWQNWQTVNRPSPSKIPDYDAAESVRCENYHSHSCVTSLTEDSLNAQTHVTDQVKEKEKRKESEGKINNNCPEQSTGQQEPNPHDGESEQNSMVKPVAVFSLPLVGDEEFGITQADIDLWAELYPAVDIMQDLRAMKGWLLSNPKKKKTKGGIKRFITSWLSRTQNNGGNLKARPAQGGGSAIDTYAESLGRWANS